MSGCGGSGGGGGGGGGGCPAVGRGLAVVLVLGGILLFCSYVLPCLGCFLSSLLGCPGSASLSGGGGGCSGDLDKTGLPDLALESLGGLILSIGDTKPAPGKVLVSIFGLPIYSQQPPPPETIIRYGAEPGNCWAFKGSKGNVVIQLIKPAVITGMHLEHIHKSLDPYGVLGSAPKEFQIWGLRDYQCLEVGQREFLGNFTFTPTVKPLQYFPIVSHQNDKFSQIELEVLSNHGDAVTCIYRVRVHGDIQKAVNCTATPTN